MVGIFRDVHRPQHEVIPGPRNPNKNGIVDTPPIQCIVADRVGDEIVVKIRGFDNKGRLNLTRLGIHPEQAAIARQEAQA